MQHLDGELICPDRRSRKNHFRAAGSSGVTSTLEDRMALRMEWPMEKIACSLGAAHKAYRSFFRLECDMILVRLF